MSKFYFYTETAFHHEGDISFLKGLIDASLETGANGIKFQVLTNPDDFISSKHSAYKDLASYCLNYEQWREIFKYTIDKGLDIILMPLNIEALQLLDEFPVKYLDVHSVSFNDGDLLEQMKNSQTDLILGIGGRTLEEIKGLSSFFKSQLKILMLGVQSFPTNLEDVSLGKISVLKKMFPELQIGYADHSPFDSEHTISSNEFAMLLGAEVFEKHISTMEGVERIDWSAAVSKEKIIEIIRRLKFIEENILTLADDPMELNEVELKYRNRQIRCVAAREIKAGELLEKKDVALKLVEDQNDTFTHVQDVIGKKLSRAINIDEPILVKDIL